MFFRKVLFIVSCIFSSFCSSAQVLDDAATQQLIKNAMDELYNYNWVGAAVHLEKVYEKYPNHPVSELMKAIRLQHQFSPIESSTKYFPQYIGHLEKCIDLSEILLKQAERPEEYVFYLLASHGFIAETYHQNKEYIKAATEGQKAYAYMKDGFEMSHLNPEFLYTNGLYNYYREQYPETHGEIKPLIVFFRKGNKTLGIQLLEKALTQANFTQVEAAFYLNGIYMKYENSYAKAVRVSTILHRKYPKNGVFLMRYIEALIGDSQHELAKQMLEKFRRQFKGGVYDLAYYLFNGQLSQNSAFAKANYGKALQMKIKGRFVDDYNSMAYVLMAQEFAREKKYHIADEFIKKAAELGEYKWVTQKIDELRKTLK